jgi:hypothetical protein
MGFGSVAWVLDKTRAREPGYSRVLSFRDIQPRLLKVPKPRADPERGEMGLTPVPCRAGPRFSMVAVSRAKNIRIIFESL